MYATSSILLVQHKPITSYQTGMQSNAVQYEERTTTISNLQDIVNILE